MGTSIIDTAKDRLTRDFTSVERFPTGKIAAFPDSADWEYQDRISDFSRRANLAELTEEELEVELNDRNLALAELGRKVGVFEIDEVYYLKNEVQIKSEIRSRFEVDSKMEYLVGMFRKFFNDPTIVNLRELLMVLNMIHRSYQNTPVMKDYSFFHGLIYHFNGEELIALANKINEYGNRSIWQDEA